MEGCLKCKELEATIKQRLQILRNVKKDMQCNPDDGDYVRGQSSGFMAMVKHTEEWLEECLGILGCSEKEKTALEAVVR
ncbi:hypothetical protein [Candidatus Contubernalis alkaliaceticus]|uniref:hypothetical protein n=1 Tax=Candidatus Contubernalis alkaliaceticus TaxID=338645 RepID=UPI001F4BD98F|nr:hypothetical protein [Candidatus Contubernalis alkalaceticus]UNC91658.1 hypothetical protein HUE98_05865 [Candidatus Contubernalis alkalaceticus]